MEFGFEFLDLLHNIGTFSNGVIALQTKLFLDVLDFFELDIAILEEMGVDSDFPLLK